MDLSLTSVFLLLVCALGTLLNMVQLVLLLRQRNSTSYNLFLISFACSDIALCLMFTSRIVIPLLGKYNSSAGLALEVCGLYSNPLNILAITIDRLTEAFYDSKHHEYFSKTGSLKCIALAWASCIAIAVAVVITDLHRDVHDMVLSTITPLVYACVSVTTLVANSTICCRIQHKIKRYIKERNARSLGRGVFINTTRRSALHNSQRNFTLCLSIVVVYFTFSYPYMLTMYLSRADHGFLMYLKSGMSYSSVPSNNRTIKINDHYWHQVGIVIISFKTVVDPVLYMCIKKLSPKIPEQIAAQRFTLNA